MKLVFEIGEFAKHTKEVLDLCKTWWEQTLMFKLQHIPYAPDMKAYTCEYAKNNSVAILGRDLDNHNCLVAVYYAVFAPYVFNVNWKHAQEAVWCIANEYRGTRAAYLLLKQIDLVLPRYGVNIWNLACPAEVKFDKVGKLLEKFGYTKMTSYYYKTAPGV